MNAILEQEVAHDRSKFIGGSDTAAILGVSPWKSAFQLYQEKTGEYQEEITPAKQKIFNRGKRWEPIVIEMLVDELEDRGHDVKIITRNQRYIDPDYGFLAAEIDLELLLDGQHINGEMKTVHPFAAKDWGEQDTDEIPIYYTSQVSHGQMVTGRNRTIVAALIGADGTVSDVIQGSSELGYLLADFLRNVWRPEGYLICQPHPLADMICQWARTGQPVWIKIPSPHKEDVLHTLCTNNPDWGFPGAEYSFTPF